MSNFSDFPFVFAESLRGLSRVLNGETRLATNIIGMLDSLKGLATQVKIDIILGTDLLKEFSWFFPHRFVSFYIGLARLLIISNCSESLDHFEQSRVFLLDLAGQVFDFWNNGLHLNYSKIIAIGSHRSCSLDYIKQNKRENHSSSSKLNYTACYM